MAIRVLVVEDSLTVRMRLAEIVEADSELALVGSTGDGKDAIELCRAQRPDVISLDMVLPTLSGVAVTEYVMAYFPTPILIVSSSTNRGELFQTYDALAAGAVEVLDKPVRGGADAAWASRYTGLLKLVSRIKAITHPRARLGSLGVGARRAESTAAAPTTRGRAEEKPGRPAVLAIGGSTGAPIAMVEILRALPSVFRLPILLVLHISPVLGDALPEWFADRSRRRVAWGEDGSELPAPGEVALAPADHHMVVRQRLIRLTRDPPRHSCRPSVDALFESVAAQYGRGAIACLLTGMGTDGATGLLAVRQAGGVTIAQDEASSVVFGMPREAIALGAAKHVVTLAEIGPAIAAVTEDA